MKTMHCTAVALIMVFVAAPAGAAYRLPPTKAPAERYVARVQDDGTLKSLDDNSAPPKLCAQDSSPADPIYFKLADGRCAGD